MKVPLLDIKRQINPIRKHINDALEKCLNETQFILGPQVEAFEKQISEYCECKYSIGVASGTDALILALQALGVGADDEVITTTYSFFATVSAIWRVGARPVLCDIDPNTFNIDPHNIQNLISKKTKAIIAVHLFGQTADMTSIQNVAGDIPVIEDAAQAIGAKWRGEKAGNMGILGCFSFFPSKNLGAFGDAGMITTSDEKLATKCRSLRVHGALQTYLHDEVGYNSRLDTIQAAILQVKLPFLDGWSASRRKNAEIYNAAFQNSSIVIPKILPDAEPIYNQYVIRIPKRDGLKEKLKEAGIGHAVYYPLPLHLQPCFKNLGYQKGDFPESEKAAFETIALPIFSELTLEELNYVADVVLAHANKSNGK